MREMILGKLISVLQRKGFAVTSFIHSNICFDLIAKSPTLTLIIKVYSNIDAIRAGQGRELKKVADIFNATALIVGGKTKAFSLNDGIIYERYDIPVLTINSLKELLEEKIPAVRYFKGRNIVELDGNKLREHRKRLGLTLEELAEKLGLTAESIHRYEKGASTSLGTAERLEEILKTDLVKGINLFEERGKEGKVYDEEFNDRILEKVHDLGLKLAVFEHAPFKAYSKPKESLLIQKGKKRPEIERKALQLKKTKSIFDSDSLIIAEKYRYKSAGEIPVIKEEELDSLSRYRDLRKLIKEREKK